MINRRGLFGAIGGLVAGLVGCKATIPSDDAWELLMKSKVQMGTPVPLRTLKAFVVGHQPPYRRYIEFPVNIKTHVEIFS